MTARDPHPQGPTTEQLRRRALAGQAAAAGFSNGPVVAPVAVPPPHGCTCPAGSYDPGQGVHEPYCGLWLPPGARLTGCSGPHCSQEIWRARTLKRDGQLGGYMPMLYPRPPVGGTLVLVEPEDMPAPAVGAPQARADDGMPVVRVATAEELQPPAPGTYRVLWTTHWGDCPDAEQFRRQG